MSTILEYIGVTKRYGRRLALDSLNLKIAKGTMFGLVGSNGAGKTTAMSIAGGIIRHQSGEVKFQGGPAFDAATQAGRLSLMPQDADLPRYARVQDLLIFYGQLQGMGKAEAARNAAEVLEWIHLADRADSPIHSLSHGMRRRVVVAQAFLGNPELILLDEPLSGLDPAEVASLREILIQRRGRQTIVVSSHNLHEIERICDHIAFIEKGRVVREGPMEEVIRHSRRVNIITERSVPDLAKFQQGLPGIAVTQAASATGTWVITCEQESETKSLAEMNRDVLKAVLAANVGIIEVRRGSDLEQEYLAARKRG